MKTRFFCTILIIFSSLASLAQTQVCIQVTNAEGESLDYSSSNKYISVCQGQPLRMVAANCAETTPGHQLTYSWRNTSRTNSTPINTAQINVSQSGVWVVTMTNSTTTETIRDTVFFQNYSRETFEITNGDVDVACANDRYIIRATRGKSNYSWFTTTNSTVLGTNDSLVINVASSNYYVAAFTDSYGCRLSDTIYIQRLERPTVNLGPDKSACFGQPVTLIDATLKHKHDSLTALGQVGYDFTWNTGAKLTSLTRSDLPVGTHTFWLRVRRLGGNPCTSVDTIRVTVYPSPRVSAGNDTVICNGNPIILQANILNQNNGTLTYQWRPSAGIEGANTQTPTVSPTSATTYWVVATNSGGCKDSSNVRVNINPDILSTTSVSNTGILCRGDSVTLSGSASGGTPYTNTGASYQYSWKDGSGNEVLTTASGKVAPPSSRYFYFHATDARGCTKKDSAMVNISTLSVALGEDRSLCGSASAQLNAVASGGQPFTTGSNYQFSWQTIAGNGLAVGTTIHNPNISPTLNSTYEVQVQDAAGCRNTSRINVFVEAPRITIQGPDTNYLCKESNLPLSASANARGSWEWTPITNIVNGRFTARPTISAHYQDNNVSRYIVRFTDDCGVTVYDSTHVKTVPRPGVIIDEEIRLLDQRDTVVCSGNLVILFPLPEVKRPGDIYTWRRNSALLNNDETYIASENGQYSLTVNNSYGCSRTESISVTTVIPPTTASIDANVTKSYCNNEPVVLTAVSDGTLLSFFWETNGRGKFENPRVQEPSYIPSVADTGNIEFMLTVSNACGQAVAFTELNLINGPKPDFEASTYYTYPGEEVIFVNNSNNDSISVWNVHDINPSSGVSHSHSHKYSWPGKYDVELLVYNKSGCKDSLYKEVEVTDKKVKFVPSYFSPISDNPSNSALKVFGTNIVDEDFHFAVYNRWGEVVYETTSYLDANKNGWNGKHPMNNSPQNTGVYTWTLKLKYFDGTIEEVKGTTTLVK